MFYFPPNKIIWQGKMAYGPVMLELKSKHTLWSSQIRVHVP
jgi:hypothetical protein